MAKEELLLTDYLRVLVRHKTLIVLTGVLAVLSTYLWVSREETRYRSQTRIKVQRQISMAGLFDEILVGGGDPLEGYVHEITSRVVLSNALVSLHRAGLGGLVLSDLRGGVSVRRVEQTDLLDIVTTGRTPEESQGMAAAVAAAFIDHHDRTITRAAQGAYDTVRDARDTVLDGLRTRQTEALDRLGTGMLAQDRTAELDILRQRQAALEVKLQDLRVSGNFTEEYPEIRQALAQKEAVERRIQAILEGQLAKQVEMEDYEHYRRVAEDMSGFFTRALEEARIAAHRKTEIVQVIEPPEPGREIAKGEVRSLLAGALLGLMLGVVLAFVSDSMDTSVRTIVEIEELYRLPVLSVIPHFSATDEAVPLHVDGVWEKMRYSRFAAGVRHTLAVLTGRRAAWAGSGPARGLIVPFAPRSPATEGYRTLRTTLMMKSENGKLKPMVVTSSGPQEGKSTTVSNLAFAMAQAGHRTLLVDANMRRPTMYRLFGLPREGGLANILAGDVAWADAVRDCRDVAMGQGAAPGLGSAPGMDKLNVIASGGRTVHPAEWLGLPRFAQLVSEWEEAYDVVLIDGPPVLPVPDSVVMGSVLGRVLLVYQVGRTARESMRRAVRLLQNAGAEVLGIVLNDVISEWVNSPDFAHYRGYYGRPEK